MDLTLLGTFFVLGLMAIRTQGATKLLNEACASGDSCDDSSGKNLVLLCDVLVKRCLIKAGQSCEDFKDLCINGAFCKTDGQAKKCTCGTGYTGDDCVAETQMPGAPCYSGLDECITNARCTDGRCACDVGYALVEGRTCAAVAANTIGATCEANPPNTKANCEDENALCPAASGGRCVCKDGYVGVTGGGCNIMPNRVGGVCRTDTAGTQGTCGDRAVCSATTGVCQCPQGYQGQPGDTVCMIQAGKSCAAPNGDKCVSHAECSAGTCTCSSGYISNSAGLCAEIPQGKVNAACDATKTCTGTHVVCEQNACKCTAGFSANKGEDDCVTEHKIETLCTPSGGGKGDCDDANAICSAARKCECKNGYSGLVGGECSELSFHSFTFIVNSISFIYAVPYL